MSRRCDLEPFVSFALSRDHAARKRPDPSKTSVSVRVAGVPIVCLEAGSFPGICPTTACANSTLFSQRCRHTLAAQ